MAEKDVTEKPSTSAAGTVAAGIFSSRIVGFLRDVAIAYFFGVGAHADVYRLAFRGPNVLQNLLGEGTISAAFIPIYSRLIEEGRQEDAGRFAGAIFGLLLAAAAGLVLVGVLLAEPIVAVLSPGFLNDAELVAAGELPINRYELAVGAVRIIFPMAGILVLSAWALGVLNSHRRFFLPYFAPVLWNVAIIAALFAAAAFFIDTPAAVAPEAVEIENRTDLLFAAFYGALVGGFLQFGVQLPLVFREMKHFSFSFSTKVVGVRESLNAFGPVLAGRGVAQLSSWLDLFLASWLAAGALSALGYAQTLYLLPVSLFGMSVAASELPELSRIDRSEMKAFLRRLDRSMRQILFLTVPTVIGYLAFGYLIVGALFQRGSFDANGKWLVYTVLGAYALGLLATTLSRLLQNAFYALDDTKTPAKIAVLRVVISTIVAVPAMFVLDEFAVFQVMGLPPDTSETVLYFGAAGLALGASVGAWTEIFLLRRALRKRTARFALPVREALHMTLLTVLAAAPAAVLWWFLPEWNTIALTLLVVGLYGTTYLLFAYLQDLPEMEAWAGRFLQRFKR